MPNIARRSVDFHFPVPSHLNRHVRGCSETIEAQPSSGFDRREPQRSKSDDSGAKERCGLLVGKSLRNDVDKILGRDDVLGITPVHAVAGELRTVAQILRPCTAVFAGSIGLMQPGNSDARTDGETPRVLACFLDATHNLVPRNYW